MEHPLDQLRPDDPTRAGDPADRRVEPGDTAAAAGSFPVDPVDPVHPVDGQARPPVESLDLESLRRKVASQPTIEQAKGMLMAYYGIDAEQAFALLRHWSSSQHVKLRDLCRAVVEAGATPGAQPYAGLRALLGTWESVGPPG